MIGTTAAVLAALVAAGCGSSDEQIPEGDAEALLAELNALEDQVNADDCTGADQTLQSLFEQAGDLPGGEPKSGVRELLQRLDTLVMERCSDLTETTTTETTETTDTEPTTTTTDTTDTTTTTETTTTEETPPNGQGPDGTGPPGQDDDGSGGLSPGGGGDG